MADPARKPVFFFIHGAWFGAWAFTDVVSALMKQGYTCWAQELPYHDGDASVDAQQTIKFISEQLKYLADQGLDIIPVSWSFGGVIGPAAFEGLWKKERVGKGEKGGIIGMVYACAPPVPKVGMSATENGGYWDGQTWFDGDAANLLVPAPLATLKTGRGSPLVRAFYNCLPASPNPSDLYDPLIRPFAFATHMTPIPYIPVTKKDPESMDEPGDFIVPTAYFLAEKDKAIPTAIQEKVVKKYEGKFAKVYRFDAGHLLWTSKTEEAVNALIEFADQVD